MPEPDPEAEFDMALARAGIIVPPERRAAMMEGFRAWCEMRELLNEPMPLATEPAFGLTQPAGPRAFSSKAESLGDSENATKQNFRGGSPRHDAAGRL
ncbi:MAG: hypothetical protein ING00_16200 [Roseomonas sp.]|nr:hypothetical protein [Roseomonas sp.]MCA3307335.1 hypothetical protein [Roseomonas sp.]